MEAKDQWFLKTFLAIAMVIAPGKTNTCNSSPQCYKTTEEASTYICEWKSMKNATYELFYRRSNSTRSLPCSERTQNNYCCVNEEEMYSKVYVDIWVVVNIGNQSCRSPISTVRLEESVKYNAPKNVSMSRSSSTLNISWNNDNGNPCDEDGEQTYKNGAEIEVKYRRREVPSETWNTIKEVVEKAMFTLKDLQPQSVYQLQVRQKSNQKNSLWSNWTPILNVSTAPRSEPKNFTSKETHNSAMLDWKPIPLPEQQGFLTHYTVCYKKQRQNKEAKSTATECHNTSASAKDYLLQNLTPGTMYEVSVAGATAAGLGPNAITSFITSAPDFYKGWIKYCIIVLITIIIITACVLIIKRHKSKIYPPLPHPVVIESAVFWMKKQDMYEMKEEVHELQVHDKCSKDVNPEEATLLITCRPYEDMDEKTLSDLLRPDYKDQVSHAETSDLNGDIDSEVAIVMYRNGLIFDMKAESKEDVDTPLLGLLQ